MFGQYEENLYVPLSVSCVPLTVVLNYFCMQLIYTYKKKGDLPNIYYMYLD